MRFFLAGVILCVWLLFQRQHLPVGRQWLSIVLLATLIFVGDYGLVFWAEQTVPSGVTAVMLATIPAFMALSEILVLRTQRMTVRLALALLIGIAGVAVLVSRSLNLGGQPINATGAMALIVASMSWSVGSILTRKLPLPSSKVVSAGSQMLIGGILLFLVSALLGELPKFHPATLSRAVWISLLYLSIAGSVIAFTAYLWLIHHQSPTKVGTYAYVNPVIAVLLGYFFAGESLGLRTVLGTLFVLISVVIITTTRAKKLEPTDG